MGSILRQMFQDYRILLLRLAGGSTLSSNQHAYEHVRLTSNFQDIGSWSFSPGSGAQAPKTKTYRCNCCVGPSAKFMKYKRYLQTIYIRQYDFEEKP